MKEMTSKHDDVNLHQPGFTVANDTPNSFNKNPLQQWKSNRFNQRYPLIYLSLPLVLTTIRVSEAKKLECSCTRLLYVTSSLVTKEQRCRASGELEFEILAIDLFLKTQWEG
jgi:hypothetical protein